MLQEIEMTLEEQVKMYMETCTKKELCLMLIESNKHLKQKPIQVVYSKEE